jgi:hypothetical protein
MTHELSAMEVARLENIKRNEEFMQSLGLETKKKPAPRASKKKKRHDKDKDYQPGEEEEDEEELVAPRRSTRCLNMGSELGLKKKEVLVSLSDGEENPQKKMKRQKGQRPDADLYFKSLDMEDEEVQVRVVLPKNLRAYVDTIGGEYAAQISDKVSGGCVCVCVYVCMCAPLTSAPPSCFPASLL